MKALFLAGGAAGFLLCLAAGFSAGRGADVILRDAALGCLAGALLVRWFWMVLVKGFREALTIHRRAVEEAAAQQQAQGHPQPAAAAPPPAAAPAAASAAANRLSSFPTPKPVTR